MSNLLRFEFRKLFRGKMLYIIFAISVLILYVGLASPTISYESFLRLVGDEELIGVKPQVGNFGVFFVDALSAMFLSTGVIFSGIIVPVVVCGDYSGGTVKNIVSRGYSKISVFLSKYITAVCAVLMVLFASVIVGAPIAAARCGAEFSFANFGKAFSDARILREFAIYLSITAIFVLLSILIRRNGLAILACLGTRYFLQIIYAVILLKNRDVGEAVGRGVPLLYSSYLEYFDFEPSGEYIVALIWIAACTALGILTAKKSDIK